jgi:hypothetical protein
MQKKWGQLTVFLILTLSFDSSQCGFINFNCQEKMSDNQRNPAVYHI